MNRPQAYQLSFVSRKVSRSAVPEIVLSFPEELFQPFRLYIEALEVTMHEHAVMYFHGLPGLHVACGEKGRFGYQGCASLVHYRGSCEIHFELREYFARAVVASLHHALVALNTFLHDLESIPLTVHESQFLELKVSCAGTFHGHSVSGYVYPLLSSWLMKKESEAEPWIEGKVVDAMHEAWSALSAGVAREYTTDVKFIPTNEHTFIFACHGKASDLGLYPSLGVCFRKEEGSAMNESIPVWFDSKNIDTCVELLTLIAGLVEMVGQAGREHSLMSLPKCA